MFCSRLKTKQMEELKFGKQQTIGNHMYDFVCFLPLNYDKGKLLA
jgi:very-short-patch-repair endonuclease